MGRRVRDARERLGMSRRAISQAAEVSERYLAQLEAGDGNASVVLLRRVAAALGVPLSGLLGDQGVTLEERLIRRFLARLPADRREDAVFALMREIGRKETERKRRIALVGLRGAGKSTLGQALARELRYTFIELDREIEREAELPLSEVFMLYGQTGYRRIERRCLNEVLHRADPVVIAAGGGIVSEPETYDLLLANCFTVWLRAAPEEHMSRVIAQGDFRPMDGHVAAMDELRRILAEREPLYGEADATIDTAGAHIDESLAALANAVVAGAHD